LASLIKTGEMRWRLIKTRKMLGLVCQFQLDLSQDILWIWSPAFEVSRITRDTINENINPQKQKNQGPFSIISHKKILIRPDQWPLVERHM